MSPSGDSGGGRGGSEPFVQQTAFIFAIAAIAGGWPLVRQVVPPDARFALADLVREHWAHRHALEPWLEQRWAWLALHGYHLWFALATLPGIIAAAIVQGVDRRTFWPLVYAPIGWVGGGALGLWLYASFRADSWPLAVMMPAAFGFLGGAIAARLAASPRKDRKSVV